MSWECRHRSGEHCNKLEVTCDPGRKGCVLHGKVYFPFAPEKNPSEFRETSHEQPRDPDKE
jgi:hypothetical protein